MGIYDENKRIEAILNRVEGSKVSQRNKDWVKKFYDDLCTRDLERTTINYYLERVWMLLQWVSKDFDQLSKEDVKEIVRKIEENGYTKNTRNMLKDGLKKILQFVHGYEWTSREYPECVKWIRIKMDNGEPREVLAKEEILKMIEGAYAIRDKAFISVLYESGCRVGELLTLRMKHLEFDNYGCIIRVEGKTGVRGVRLVSSVVYLSQWISAHPNKSNNDSPLWVSMGKRNNGNQISYHTMVGILKDIAKKVGIEKRINPHSFRHARCTHLASKLTEAQMKTYFGWTQSSKMASVYVHMSGRDIDNAILQMHGILPEEQKKEEISLRICPLCSERNTTDYCRRCGSSLINSGLQNIMQIMEKMIDARMKEKQKH